MRHGKKFNHLGRKASHRKAMLSNMAASLILHKRISTTLAKAKELRKYVEPLVTRAKEDTTHNRRIAFSYLQNKEAIKALFGEVIEKVASRPGGYTRIIKTGFRLGDNAEMCIIELVDFNELMLKEAKPEKKKTRRSRRGSGKSAEAADATTEAKAEGTEEASSEAKEEKAPKAKKKAAEPKAKKEDKAADDKAADGDADSDKETKSE
ncbi:50S ribosomal protein L17 [Echinicola vietnamensis]|uniref:Large ribosomal subunit protein bL17 n=1 Tax=Echinicola vietnamensis (strain DSM 17526 / LMG 23754 / KMM 6221) TaxID=926556 RepID=L0FTC2_ECHVK|nr:50S ribosomal protein L17 [Echinicola vietnamensis]AGA76522.1 ribosomal protein L17 [Echinicola vietnamensis DSM 17526]